jgi:hypothetical protein
MYLDINDNGIYDAGDVLAPQLTTATGNYFFTGLGATNYVVRLVTNPGELTSTPVGNAFTKQTLNTGANPLGLVAADFNGDGRPDLASADGSADKVSVRLQQVGGGFATRVEYAVGVQPTGIAVGKFNNDNFTDIAVVHWALSRVIFLINNGNGTFTRSPNEIAVPSGYTSIVAADFNNDTRDDLAIAVDGATDVVRVLVNNWAATPSFSALPDINLGTAAPLSIAAGRIDSDALPDLVVGNFDADTVQVLKNMGGTSFAPQTAIAVGDGPSSVAIADINGDGKADVVGTSIGTNSVFRLLGNGSAILTSSTPVPVGQGPRSVVVADVDDDNDQDLIVGNAQANDVVVLRNLAGVFSFPESTGLASFASLVASGVKQVLVTDLDANGVVDLAAVRGDSNTGSLAVLNNAIGPGSHRLTLNGTNQVFDKNFGVTIAAPPGLTGDYNNNGGVDTADYVVWRKNLNQSVTLPNDSTPGTVVQADYDVWRANFGNTSGSGASAVLSTDAAAPAAEPIASAAVFQPEAAPASSAALVTPVAEQTALAARDEALAGFAWTEFPQGRSSANRPTQRRAFVLPSANNTAHDLLFAALYSLPAQNDEPAERLDSASIDEMLDENELGTEIGRTATPENEWPAIDTNFGRD